MCGFHKIVNNKLTAIYSMAINTLIKGNTWMSGLLFPSPFGPAPKGQQRRLADLRYPVYDPIQLFHTYT
jgi:hypothetical protein